MKNAQIPVPSYVPAERAAAYIEAMRKFYAMGSWFDEGVAQLIEKLDETGELENTLFLFYIDNGDTYGRPAKNTPYEKGVRTPMIVTWPGHVPEGKQIDEPQYALDLHATILDYAGLGATPHITSKSLRPLIETGSRRSAGDAIFGSVFAHHAYAYAGDRPRSAERDLIALYARTGRWKFVLCTQDVGPHNQKYFGPVLHLTDTLVREAGEVELYDLKADPYEERNLASDPEQQSRMAELRRRVLEWWMASGGKQQSLPE